MLVLTLRVSDARIKYNRLNWLKFFGKFCNYLCCFSLLQKQAQDSVLISGQRDKRPPSCNRSTGHPMWSIQCFIYTSLGGTSPNVSSSPKVRRANMMFCLETRATRVENWAKFCTFWPPQKLEKGWENYLSYITIICVPNACFRFSTRFFDSNRERFQIDLVEIDAKFCTLDCRKKGGEGQQNVWVWILRTQPSTRPLIYFWRASLNRLGEDLGVEKSTSVKHTSRLSSGGIIKPNVRRNVSANTEYKLCTYVRSNYGIIDTTRFRQLQMFDHRNFE